jgi:hypothetical protein
VLAERVEKQSGVRILDAIRKKLPLSRTDLEIVALYYFRRLGHDKHRRLFKVYGYPVQYGVTGGGHDGAVFSRYGSVDRPPRLAAALLALSRGSHRHA